VTAGSQTTRLVGPVDEPLLVLSWDDINLLDALLRPMAEGSGLCFVSIDGDEMEALQLLVDRVKASREAVIAHRRLWQVIGEQ
jgi:hypothetical protein